MHFQLEAGESGVPSVASVDSEPAVPPPPPPPPPFLPDENWPDEEMAGRIGALMDTGRNGFGDWGIEIISIDENRLLFSRNADREFTPASNAKLFTTAAALDRLGPDFRFRTTIAYEGFLTPSGDLRGHLVMFGGGDPDLDGRISGGKDPLAILDSMASRIREMGVRRIEGDVIGDDSYFSYSPWGRGWVVDDVQQHYGAPISALSFYGNVLNVTIRPGASTGKPVQVGFRPETSTVQLLNLAVTGPPSRFITLDHSRIVSDGSIYVRGRLPISVPSWERNLPVGNPALYTAQIFRERLQLHGIEVIGKARSRHSGENPLPLEPVELLIHHSIPLKEIIPVINKDSHNQVAEILLRTLGAEGRNNGVDWAGIEEVKDFVAAMGISIEGLNLYDGSGLSKLNRVTPRVQTRMLARMAESEHFEDFLNSLAVSGQDGTLKRRLRARSTNARIFAKTGTLNRVVTLGGYVETRSGHRIAFTIFANDHPVGNYLARQVTDRICEILADS